jgi:hypothetical protein
LDVVHERLRRLRMKRAGIVIVVGLLLCVGLPAFSQAQTYPKDAYVKTVPLMKVWMNQLGYVLQFFSSKSQVANIYVPISWFNKGADSKADIIYGNEPSYPYCSIFWVDGKFDHIKLYVLNNYNSPSWGVVGSGIDLTSNFNVQEVPKDF